jgi:hypothetical protein
MAALSALCLDPSRFPLLYLYLFSPDLESNRVLPLFGPVSSSGALAFGFYHGDHFVRNGCK